MDERIQKIRESLCVEKIVVSRSKKFKNGDFFVSYSLTEDMLENPIGENESPKKSLMDIKIATALMQLEAEKAVYQAAYAASEITTEEYQMTVKTLQSNYSLLISHMLKKEESPNA